MLSLITLSGFPSERVSKKSPLEEVSLSGQEPQRGNRGRGSNSPFLPLSLRNERFILILRSCAIVEERGKSPFPMRCPVGNGKKNGKGKAHPASTRIGKGQGIQRNLFKCSDYVNLFPVKYYFYDKKSFKILNYAYPKEGT
jgi:hypothetical protein